MSKILHAKQSRCLKPKQFLVLIYMEKILRKNLLNYMVVEHVQTFPVCIFYRSHKGRQSLALICISAEELTFMK